MAGADYRHCDKCYQRVFYDADIVDRIDGDEGYVGEVKFLCHDCAKTCKIVIVKRKTGRIVKE